jgi:hypothetical protein
MVQVYTPHDIDLRGECLLRLRLDPAATGSKEHVVAFQFPPRILSDNRKGSWEEGDLRGKEPVSVFKTSGPREISLSWTYIVTGGDWTTESIAKQVHAIRGYFASVRDKDEKSRNLVVDFRYIHFGNPTKHMSARIKAIDVKHGDTLVFPPGNAKEAFPLRTDIVVDLRLWTKGGDSEQTQDLERLFKNLTPEWY